jgi:hypothetical protein
VKKSEKDAKTKRRAYDKEYRRLNKNKLNKQKEVYRKRNPHIYRAISNRYKEKHKDRVKKSDAKYSKKNPALRAASTAKRRALKKQATPVWANYEVIKAIYLLSKIFSNWTGVKYHVDHIVPINSSLVCGLHVEHNLQILIGKDNITKSNKIWPDMP